MAVTYHRVMPEGAPLEEKYARVLERLAPGSRVLEVGCHSGYFAVAMVKAGHRVTAIERDAEAAQLASGKGFELIVGDVEDEGVFRRIQDRFDVILLMDVLEHLVDPATALGRLKGLLASGGKVIVTGPNVAYWAVRKDLLLGRWEYRDSGILDRTHLRFFNADGWKGLLREAGFEVKCFGAADGMLPLEHLWKRFFGKILAGLRARLMNRFPQLFAITFLVEGVPHR